MKTIYDFNFKNKKALIRVDFNVPMNDKLEITDDSRIRAALPTVNKVLSDGGSVVLMSHRGRPKAKEESLSMAHLLPHLEKLLDQDVLFSDDCIGEKTENKVKKLKSNDVLMLENLRFYDQETKGDANFAGQLSRLGDIYINDAFGTAHRAHASTAIIASYFGKNKCFGKLMHDEITNIDKILKNAKRPLTAIMGGAKVSSKITIISRLMDTVDNLIIGGGMTYTFIKALGGSVGSSLVENDKLDLALDILKLAKEKNVNLLLPSDSLNGNSFSNDANILSSKIDDVQDGYMGLDIEKETIANFKKTIESSGAVLWNGPMGVFEMENFSHGTKSIAQALVKATEKGAFTLVGGGDSVAAINKYNLSDKVSYVSTGGGAMLEYLEGKTLPGIAAITE
ncbi:MAG: phosphoglycerate kinase [Flavobacteriales bacterium]